MLLSNKQTLQAVILDWTGTVLDCGALGQAELIADIFTALGVSVFPSDVLPLSGLCLGEQIDKVCDTSRVSHAWRMQHGRTPDRADRKMLVEAAADQLAAHAKNHTRPIPGAVEAMQSIREAGLLIGACSEYPRQVTAAMAHEAGAQGCIPNALVSISDVSKGRPAPDMCLEAMRRLGVEDSGCAVKIGDSVNDVLEGVRAGAWVIGLTLSGCMAGLDEHALRNLGDTERALLHHQISREMLKAGAHYTAPDLLSCLPILEEIAENYTQGYGVQ